MEFNMKKCKVVEMGKGEKRPSWNYVMENGLRARAAVKIWVIIQKDVTRQARREDYRREIQAVKNFLQYMDEELSFNDLA